MPEAYSPTDDEKKLQVRFTLTGSVHDWELKDKVAFIAFINKKAGLPFGTIGLLRTEQENWKTKVVTVKEFPYASRQTTVELGRLHKISVLTTDRIIQPDMAIYTARAKDIDTGREVDATGACALTKKDGSPLDALSRANKIMHADTKSKRRATLEICGLAFMDDSELDTVDGATEIKLEAPDAVSGGATTPKPSTGESQQSKGNGKASTSPATTTVTTPAPAPQAPVASVVDSPSESAGSNAAPEPQAEAPKGQAAAEPAASSPATNVVTPAARYAAHELMVGGPSDDTLVGADARYLKLIVEECTKTVGWDVPTMSKWLVDAYGLTNSNKKETLTFGMFKLIMNTIDGVLTKAGR